MSNGGGFEPFDRIILILVFSLVAVSMFLFVIPMGNDIEDIKSVVMVEELATEPFTCTTFQGSTGFECIKPARDHGENPWRLVCGPMRGEPAEVLLCEWTPIYGKG